MRVRNTLIAVLIAGTVAFGQSSSRSRRSDRSDRSSRTSSRHSTTQPASFIEDYRLVLDRNIFSRTRVIYREPTSTQPSAPISYQSQPALAFTGVTEDGGTVTAFIEDRRSGRTTLYHVGDGIGDGQKITSINLDSIEYTTKDGRAVRVELGNALESGPSYAVSSGSPVTNPSTGTVTTPGTTGGSGDSNDILEKLRQRRLQETKR